MRNVMLKAQALAEAILESGVYQRMHELEAQVAKDEAATTAIAAYMEKRSAVQALIGSAEFNPEKLAEAGQALEAAEKAMNECPMVEAMRDAQQQYQQMMENINRILRLVVTGEVEEEGCSGNCASCGSCGSCGGCE